MKFLKKLKTNDSDFSTQGAPDADEVLRQHDKESKFRKLDGFWKLLVTVVSCVFMAYQLYTSRFGAPIAMIHRAIHLGFLLFLIWIYYPCNKKSRRDRPTYLDMFFSLLSAGVCAYLAWNVIPFAMRAGVANNTDYIIGAILCLLVIEATRRVVGNGLVVLSIIGMIYVYFGRSFPGVLMHRGYSLYRMIYQLALTDQGIFGIPMGVSATYLVIFILMGAMLERSGLGKLFNDIALVLGGRFVGGPAKVSVIASAMMGTISGSSASNVATTGAFTIPLMKKTGYSPAFAGAVEAAASTGGQLMPPIMGTVAFVMAEYIGVPYLSIAAAAVIPALLYFCGVFFQLDLKARSLKLRGLDKSEIPDIWLTLKNHGLMFIPIVILVWYLMKGVTPLYAAFYAIVATWVLSLVRKDTRIGPKEAVQICINASRSALGVGIAMACAGFVVAAMSMTGIGLILAENITSISGGNLFVALLLTMVISIVLGMGLPTSACYIITSTISVPLLTEMGVSLFQAHFFVLYFACLSTITPPVAISAYVGAGMAGADPNKVGFIAFRLALAGFIVPFFFIYSPEMLLISDSTIAILEAAVTGVVGTFLLAVGAEGYLAVKLPIWLRIVFFGSALMLLAPGTVTDIAGVALVVLGLAVVYMLKKRQDKKAVTA